MTSTAETLPRFEYFDRRSQQLFRLFFFNRSKLQIEGIEDLIAIAGCVEQWYYTGYIEDFDIMVVVER